MSHNVLQLQEFGDCGDENFLPQPMVINCTNVSIRTEPPLCQTTVIGSGNLQS